ncbi:unnamed protein product [Oncorhynchus mykiss]|uniref:Rab-GAP TBC domain-containing protein n=1 Tax=Oncorhynchus mykiss TaxID=8022 RepID=A0A060YBN4_ONCMY|nr:unnamed protein product [Oncorhynchus mykiss]
MLSASNPTQTPPSGEDSSGSDRGSEVSVGAPATETDRFGFILGNGSTTGSEGPSPELVRQREAKWINIISQWDRVLLKNSSKVKEQCQKGIPASLRAKCWPLLCGATDRMRHNKDLYQTLDSRPALQSWVDIIERDLDRQFPFHEMFLSRDGHGQRGLFRVLKAFTQLKPEEGYCQAQGPVAAVLLMNMPTEQAFWCLVQISEQYLPGYYSPLLEGVLFDAAMLTRVLKRTCPAAHKHLQRHGVEPLMFATDWLMCLFTRHLPFNTLLRVWDLFFCYGVRVLFQVAVVLVRRALGRVEQREACEGQMETLERLRGVREQVQQEDDTFIAEVCSVPLSSKDLERQTERELEEWRMERPASTFDPRGRCHGYRMAKEREKGNLSLPLIRSPSLLSLSPSLLRKKWIRGSRTDIGEWEGEGREVRKVSQEERSEGGNLRRRSEMDGSPVKAPGVPCPATEDRAPVETREPLEHKEPLEQEDRRQKTQLTPEPSQQRQLTSDHSVTSQGQGEEHGGLSQTPVSEQHSDSQTQETDHSKDTMQTQEVLNKQSTASANFITVHIVTETKGEAEKSKETETCAGAMTEETAPHTDLKTYTEEETAPHTELKTYTEEETAPDTELKTYPEEETAPDTELKTYTEEETAPDTELKTYIEAKTEEERVTETYTDVEIQIRAEAKTEGEMEAEVQKGLHTDKSVETETDMGSKETATQTDVNTDTETDTQQEADVNLEAETDTGSLTERDKGTGTETHTDKEIQAHTEIQSHKGTETHTDEKSEAERETALEAHTEPETQEENESAMHIEADTRVEAELGSQIEAETQTDKESEIRVAVYIGIETRTEKATDTNTGTETTMESPHDIQRRTETEVQYTEPSSTIAANQSQVSPELTSTTEPVEERNSSEQKLPEKPQSPVTIRPDQETQKVRESEGEKEKKASTDILPPLHQGESLTGDFPHIPDNPKSQSQSESPPPADSKADSGNSVSTQIDVSSQRTTPCDGPWATPSGDFRLCKSSSSRRLTRRLSEDLFTKPNQSQPTFTQSNQSNIGFIQSNQPQPTSPIQVPKCPESSKRVTGSNPDTVPPQTGPTDTSRLFGLFRRLKGEQPRQDKEKGEHKVPIPQILIQDFSDGTGEGSTPQTRGKSFQVLHSSVPLPGNSGSQTFGSKRNSTPSMETYF